MLSRILIILGASLTLSAYAQTEAPQSSVSEQAAQEEVAQTPNPAIEAVSARFTERFGNMPVTEVRETPYGLFEVRMGDSLIYVDDQVTFVMDGHLIDAESRRNLTQERLDELSRVNFSELPIEELAIKQVRGDGSRQIAIFEDPNCGYCKLLRKNMEDIDNLTIHTFLLPILSQDSVDKARNVWCAEDPDKTWDDWMLRGQEPSAAECDAPVGEWMELGRSLLVQGTPAIFFEDGSRVPGAISKDDLLERLDAAK